MKSILLKSLFLVVFFSLHSCQSKFSVATQSLHDEVMKVHDDIMPEMGTIHKLRKALKKAIKNETLNDVSREQYEAMMLKLENADEAMMSWMHDFKYPDEASEPEQIKFLNDQKGKIKEVDKLMRNAIAEAKKMVDGL